METDLAARDALVEFTLALRWAGGNDSEAHLGMGRCYELLGDDQKAEEAYLAAGDLPAAKTALAWLWAARLLEGRKDRDWKAYILQNVPEPSRVRLLAEGNWREILAPFSADRDNAIYALTQGVAAIELRRWDEAVSRLDAALRLRPADSTMLYYKGVALYGKGDRAGAVALWTEALKHKPKDWGLQSETQRRIAAGD